MANNTKTEFVESMQRIFTEIDSLNEELKDLKSTAKDKGFNPTLLAKVAKARSCMKTDELRDNSEATVKLIDEVRGNV